MVQNLEVAGRGKYQQKEMKGAGAATMEESVGVELAGSSKHKKGVNDMGQ